MRTKIYTSSLMPRSITGYPSRNGNRYFFIPSVYSARTQYATIPVKKPRYNGDIVLMMGMTPIFEYASLEMI